MTFWFIVSLSFPGSVTCVALNDSFALEEDWDASSSNIADTFPESIVFTTSIDGESWRIFVKFRPVVFKPVSNVALLTLWKLYRVTMGSPEQVQILLVFDVASFVWFFRLRSVDGGNHENSVSVKIDFPSRVKKHRQDIYYQRIVFSLKICSKSLFTTYFKDVSSILNSKENNFAKHKLIK